MLLFYSFTHTCIFLGYFSPMLPTFTSYTDPCALSQICTGVQLDVNKSSLRLSTFPGVLYSQWDFTTAPIDFNFTSRFPSLCPSRFYMGKREDIPCIFNCRSLWRGTWCPRTTRCSGSLQCRVIYGTGEGILGNIFSTYGRTGWYSKFHLFNHLRVSLKHLDCVLYMPFYQYSSKNYQMHIG
jgi:hypothetical protein